MHDIAYACTQKTSERNKADKLLSKEAWKRFKSSDASIGEKVAALGVSGIMKVKSKLGFGLKNTSRRKKTSPQRKKKKNKSKPTVKQLLKAAMKNAKTTISSQQHNTIENASELAVDAAKLALAKKKITKATVRDGLPRVIPVPKIGGALPLIPIFAGLSALGALMGGSASVANAVLAANNAKKKLTENKRHNEMLEAISLGKSASMNNRIGSGLFLGPYKKGFGLYLNHNPFSKN